MRAAPVCRPVSVCLVARTGVGWVPAPRSFIPERDASGLRGGPQHVSPAPAHMGVAPLGGPGCSWCRWVTLDKIQQIARIPRDKFGVQNVFMVRSTAACCAVPAAAAARNTVGPALSLLARSAAPRSSVAQSDDAVGMPPSPPPWRAQVRYTIGAEFKILYIEVLCARAQSTIMGAESSRASASS